MSSAQAPLPETIPEIAEEIARRKWATEASAPSAAARRQQVKNLIRLLRRIRDMAEYVIRFQHAADLSEVRYNHYYRFASVVLAAFTGAGLIALKVDPTQLEGFSWAFGATVVALGFNTALELYKVFDVEKKALLALSAQEAGSLLKTNTESGLRDVDPMTTLESLLPEAGGLSRTFHQLLSPAPASEVNGLFRNWVDHYYDDWELSAAVQQTKKRRGPP